MSGLELVFLDFPWETLRASDFDLESIRHPNGSLRYQGDFKRGGGQLREYDPFGVLKALAVFRPDKSLHIAYGFDTSLAVGSCTDYDCFQTDDISRFTKQYTAGELNRMEFSTYDSYGLRLAQEQGVNFEKIIKPGGAAPAGVARYGRRSAIHIGHGFQCDLETSPAMKSRSCKLLPRAQAYTGALLLKGRVPMKHEGIFRMENEAGRLVYVGGWKSGQVPEGQHLLFWENGNVREFAYWLYGRPVGIVAGFHEWGGVSYEEYYSTNGAIDATGFLVEYESRNESPSIAKFVKGQRVEGILDPDTGCDFLALG